MSERAMRGRSEGPVGFPKVPTMSQALKQPVFFHVGYPKTASTFMQDEIFAKSQELAVVSHDDAEDIGLFVLKRADQLSESRQGRKGRNVYEIRTEADREAGIVNLRRRLSQVSKPIVFTQEAMSMGNWMEREKISYILQTTQFS